MKLKLNCFETFFSFFSLFGQFKKEKCLRDCLLCRLCGVVRAIACSRNNVPRKTATVCKKHTVCKSQSSLGPRGFSCCRISLPFDVRKVVHLNTLPFTVSSSPATDISVRLSEICCCYFEPANMGCMLT